MKRAGQLGQGVFYHMINGAGGLSVFYVCKFEVNKTVDVRGARLAFRFKFLRDCSCGYCFIFLGGELQWFDLEQWVSTASAQILCRC